jgi:hypothetical protein
MSEANQNTEMEIQSESVVIGSQASQVVALAFQSEDLLVEQEVVVLNKDGKEGNSTKFRDVAALH